MSASIDDLAGFIRERKQDMLDAAGAATYQTALSIAGVAQEEAPVDTGFLQNSIYVGPPQIRGESITCTVGSGARYAAAVHELNKPFFLISVDRHRPRMREIVDIFFKQALENGRVIRPQGEFPTTLEEGLANAGGDGD